MGVVADAFASFNQGLMMILSFLGIILAVVAAIYASANCSSDYIVYAYVFYALFCVKNMYDFGFDIARLKKQINRLDNETDQLEQSVDALTAQNNNFSSNNAALQRNNKDLVKTNADLKAIEKQLNDDIKIQVKAVSDLQKSNTMLHNQIDELHEIKNSLENQRDELHTLSMTQRASLEALAEQIKTRDNQLNQQSEQINELTRLLENSKKMVTNLILAGDDYKKFNTKFGESLSTLGETSKDLRTHTELLGKIANSLAKQVPDSRIDKVEVAQELVAGDEKKTKKLKEVVIKKMNAIGAKNAFLSAKQ